MYRISWLRVVHLTLAVIAAMPELLVHKMYRMIALHVNGAVFAVFPNAFSELVDMLLPDLDHMARISLKFAVSPIGSPGTQEDVQALPARHALFISRLQHRMTDVGHLLTFSLNGEEVPRYLPDILEGYRGNHIGEFGFAIDELHGSDHTVVTLKAYDPPSFFERVTKAERAPRQRMVIPIGDIQSIVGTSLRLKLQLTGSVLWLTRNGSLSTRDDG